MPSPKSFSISPATPDDATALTTVWFKAFNTAGILAIVPDAPESRDWLAASMVFGMEPSRGTQQGIIMTMTDDSSPTRKIVAWARWFHFPAGDFGSWTERWVDQLPENMSFEKLGPAFLDKMASQHVRALSGRPHWFLEVLVTHEDYRGLGLGSRLVKWGTEQADKEGVECYLDGGAKAQPLYEKFGFEVVDCMEEGVLSKPMRRDLKVPN